MSRFAIEHLPRNAARYLVAPIAHAELKHWLQKAPFHSLIRTTELISAIESDAGIELHQSDDLLALRPGDEALLISLSFGVLLAWAEGKISPLPDDWRCLLVAVEDAKDAISTPVLEAVIEMPLPGDLLAEEPS